MTLLIEAQAPPLHADRDGVIRVGKSRVTLNTVIHAFRQGHTAEEIVAHYPVLQLADVYAVISYYLRHRQAVHAYLQEQEAAAELVWRDIEAAADFQLFRQRLLARRDRQ